jgi:hypothetical protein
LDVVLWNHGVYSVNRKTQTTPLPLSENSKLRTKKPRKPNSSTSC